MEGLLSTGPTPSSFFIGSVNLLQFENMSIKIRISWLLFNVVVINMLARKGVKSAKGRRYPHDSRDNLAAGREAWKLYWKTAEQEVSSKYPREENKSQ